MRRHTLLLAILALFPGPFCLAQRTAAKRLTGRLILVPTGDVRFVPFTAINDVPYTTYIRLS